MKTTHKGMGLTEADWNKSVEHLKATLDKFKVPDQERTDVLSFIGGLKDVIVDSN